MQINLNTYQSKEFTCPNCSWQGKGSELDTENFSEDHFIIDLECPKCGEHIGSGQAEITDPEKYAKYLRGEVIDEPSTTHIFSDKFGRSIVLNTEKNTIRLDLQDLADGFEKEICITVTDASLVCKGLKCHRNDLEEHLLWLLYNKSNATEVFSEFLDENKIHFDYYSEQR